MSISMNAPKLPAMTTSMDAEIGDVTDRNGRPGFVPIGA